MMTTKFQILLFCWPDFCFLSFQDNSAGKRRIDDMNYVYVEVGVISPRAFI